MLGDSARREKQFDQATIITFFVVVVAYLVGVIAVVWNSDVVATAAFVFGTSGALLRGFRVCLRYL